MGNVSLKVLEFFVKKRYEPRCSPNPSWVFAILVYLFVLISSFQPKNAHKLMAPPPNHLIYTGNIIYTWRLQTLSPSFLTTFSPMRRISNPECFSSSFLF